MMVEGASCSDVSYLERPRRKHSNVLSWRKLEEALRLYGYNVNSLSYICGSTGSQ